jgi:hypothetical protein
MLIGMKRSCFLVESQTLQPWFYYAYHLQMTLDHIYKPRTPELPSGCARKAWLNLHKKFYPIGAEMIHELKNEFNMLILNRHDKNPAIRLAQLNKIRQNLNDDYNKDTDVLQHIMYNKKPAMYQIILSINKACLAHETIQHVADNTLSL